MKTVGLATKCNSMADGTVIVFNMTGVSETIDWQGDKSLKECNRYMLENNIADVTFKLDYKEKEGCR